MNSLRSKPSFQLFMVLALLAALVGSAIGSTPAYAATLIVTNTNNSGAGSLRGTIGSAGIGDTITFDAALSGATIHLATTLNLARDVTIDGSALAAQITISGDTNNDGTGDVRVFSVNTGVAATLDSLMITKGWTTTNGPGGGGIYNNGGTLSIVNSTLSGNSAGFGGGIHNDGILTVTNSTFANNAATQTSGGGIGNLTNGTLTVTNSTFSGNSTNSLGGGMVNFGTSIVTNSTFSGNSAQAGGGVENDGTLTIMNSTFSGNSVTNAGSGIYNYTSGTLNYANTITANSTGSDCYSSGTIGTNTNNLVESGPTCSASLSGDPSLGALDDNGGATQTFALLSGSSAIDAGDDSTCTAAPVNGLDQRGVARPIGAHCDIGAYEYEFALVVTSNADTDDGTCDTADCTLREAINAANTNSGADIIYFANNYTIMLESMLPDITDELRIDGESNAIVIDGNAHSVVDIRAAAVLNNLTIQDGYRSQGGAIINHNTLTMKNSTFNNNSADSNAGAIYNLGTLTITNSTFSNNSTGSGGGGAIRNEAGTLTITNSTFDSNTADFGGAIISSGPLTVINSTFSGNAASSSGGGGIYAYGSTFSYANTIIANSTGGDCFKPGTTGTNTNNLVEDGSCSASLSGDPSLGTLANNGGATKTFALLAGSTAINAGDDSTCAAAPVSKRDQRRIVRPNGPHCDIGAYEYVDTSAPTITAFTATSPSASVTIPITAFTATDDVSVTGYMITASATPPAADAAGWSGTAPTTYVVGSDGSYTLYPWAKDAAGHVSAVFGTPANVIVDTTAPSVTAFTASSPSASLNIPITSFTASDAGGVTGYIITESTTPPAAGAAGWSGIAPTTYAVASDGSYTLYPWAKDATDHVSPVFGTPATVSVDTSAPSVTAFTAAASSSSLTIPITTFTASDIVAVTGYKITESATPPAAGAAGWSATAPTTYVVASDDNYMLYPWAKDAAGNISAVFGTPANVSVDTSAPSVVSSTRANANPNTATSVDFIVTFSEPVTGVDATDFSLTTTGSISGAMVSGVSGSGKTHTVTVSTGSGDGTIRLNVVANNSIIDATTNPLDGAFTSGESYTIDKTGPIVAAITRMNPNPSAANSVDFSVTFSKSVTGVDVTDFNLVTTGSISGAVVSGVSGSGTTYIVTVSTGSGDGTLRLDVVDNDSIVDATTNRLGGAGAGNGAFTGGEMYTIQHSHRIYVPFVMRS